LAHHKKKRKKVETMEAPQNNRFYGKMECLRLWPSYIGEKGRTLLKTYGIKARCYWEHSWGTPWEHVVNNGKMEKKNLPCPKLKRKKLGYLLSLFAFMQLYEHCVGSWAAMFVFFFFFFHFCNVASGATANGRVGFSFKDFVIQPKW
jgi:hypothetical protein